jgi:hypothetical protein
MGYSSLAPVVAGWSGTMTINGIVVTPRTRESVASLIARATVDCYAQTGLAVSWSVSASGVISCSAASAFDLVLSGVVDNRTGFTGSYTGAASYTAAGAFTGAYVPAYGLRLNGRALAQRIGSAVSDGSSGFTGPLTAGAQDLVMWTGYADAWAAEADVLGVYDVWYDGRVAGRVLLEDVKRTSPLTRLRDSIMALECSARAVVE